MLKQIVRNLHRYVLWALMSGVLWAWIFTLIFSAPAKKKVVLYADLPDMDRTALSIELEEHRPEGIRLVETGLFDGALFDSSAVLRGDLYLIPESKAAEYLASFAPIDRADFPGETFYESDGQAYGILVYDEETGLKTGTDYVFYIPPERCWLFFNKDSIHTGGQDRAAIEIACHFLTLR